MLARIGVCATLIFLGAIGAAQLPTAHAQSGYPNRPVTLVVPYPAGGKAAQKVGGAAVRIGHDQRHRAVWITTLRVGRR